MATLSIPRSRRLPASLVLVLPALLFGLLVTMQWRTQTDRNDLTVRYNAPLLDAAQSLQNEQNTLKDDLAKLRAELDDIQRSSSSQGALAQDLQTRIDDLRTAVGLTERTGKGVTITLDDARSAAGIAPSDVDRAICHSTDLTDLINAARRGGAVPRLARAQGRRRHGARAVGGGSSRKRCPGRPLARREGGGP